MAVVQEPSFQAKGEDFQPMREPKEAVRRAGMKRERGRNSTFGCREQRLQEEEKVELEATMMLEKRGQSFSYDPYEM